MREMEKIMRKDNQENMERGRNLRVWRNDCRLIDV